MSRAYKNKKFNTDNYTKYGVSPKYFGVQASRFPGSIKKQYCDEDSNGFADATYTKRRAEAVRKGTGCVQRVILSPDFGPENLGFAVPESGPLNLTQVKPGAGPSNLSTTIQASSVGPTSLSSTIVKPATGPANLLGEPQLAPDLGPTNISSNIIVPQSGPQSVTSSVMEDTFVVFRIEGQFFYPPYDEMSGGNYVYPSLTNFPAANKYTVGSTDYYALPTNSTQEYTVSYPSTSMRRRNSTDTAWEYIYYTSVNSQSLINFNVYGQNIYRDGNNWTETFSIYNVTGSGVLTESEVNAHKNGTYKGTSSIRLYYA